MVEEKVVELYGKPDKVYYKASAPKNYYEQGHAHKDREISNKVFIYRLGEPIMYVYFDETNKVEDVFVGGS